MKFSQMKSTQVKYEYKTFMRSCSKLLGYCISKKNMCFKLSIIPLLSIILLDNYLNIILTKKFGNILDGIDNDIFQYYYSH